MGYRVYGVLGVGSLPFPVPAAQPGYGAAMKITKIYFRRYSKVFVLSIGFLAGVFAATSISRLFAFSSAGTHMAIESSGGRPDIHIVGYMGYSDSPYVFSYDGGIYHQSEMREKGYEIRPIDSCSAYVLLEGKGWRVTC